MQLTQTRLSGSKDKYLDELASAVKRIGTLGRSMHEELEQWGELLGDLDERLGGTFRRLKSVTDRIDFFMKKNLALSTLRYCRAHYHFSCACRSCSAHINSISNTTSHEK